MKRVFNALVFGAMIGMAALAAGCALFRVAVESANEAYWETVSNQCVNAEGEFDPVAASNFNVKVLTAYTNHFNKN